MQQIEADKRLNKGNVEAFINQFRTEFETRKQQDLAKANTATPRTTKLSTLQRQILAIALRWHGKAHSDVYSSDIKVEFFGWQAMSHYWNGWVAESNIQPGTARLPLDHPSMANWSDGGQIFDRKSIGESRYNAVSVSVSRALKRLTKRHLLYQSGAGWSLTDHGIEVAKTVGARLVLNRFVPGTMRCNCREGEQHE